MDVYLSRKPPSVPPAQFLVLYRANVTKPRQWRYSVVTEQGTMEGYLPETDPDCELEFAQDDLLMWVSHITNRTYSVQWSPGAFDWWTAEVTQIADA
jgi:hypothetical protein